MVIKLIALGASLMLSLGACATLLDEPGPNEACDHRQPKTHVVKVTIPQDISKPPSVNKNYVVACFEDEIIFEAKKDADFSIKFNMHGSPFGENLKSSNGKALGKVTGNPKKRSKFFKYDVVDGGNPKRPVLDPRIIITPK